MKITKMNRVTAKLLMERMDKLAAELSQELGMKVALKSGSIGAGSLTVKLELAVVGESGQADTTDARAFKAYASSYGLQPSDLGREFVYGGITYRVAGLRPKADRFPILASRQGEERMTKFPAETVRVLLGTATARAA